jgi:hypothetical protein
MALRSPMRAHTEGWPSGKASVCYAEVWLCQRGFDSHSLRSLADSPNRKVGRAVRHSLGMRRSGREASGGSTPSPSAGGFGMGTPSRFECGGPHRVWGFDSLTLRFCSHACRSWKGGHLVWRTASKAVGVLPQGVRFPLLPLTVGSPMVGQRSVTPRRFGACRFESCPTDDVLHGVQSLTCGLDLPAV